MNAKIVQIETEGEIGLIRLTNPPVNALGVALRSAVYDALHELLDTASIKAIVIYGEGRFFSAGADIKDFGRANEKPTLPDLLKALNDSHKPIIAALHGVAFGGALELALAAHVRVGITGLRIGLPEVKLGLLPGAGGTQRLPRLTGMASAIEVICTGRDVSASKAIELGILSRLMDGTARDAGIVAAQDTLDGALEVQATDSLTIEVDHKALKAARNKFANGLNAPIRAIDAIEAASLPIDEGLVKERALFMKLMQGEERSGLVHAFFAERATTKIPEKNAPKRTIESVGVVGGGTMGVGIATACLIAGYRVHLIELQIDSLESAKSAIQANLAGALKRGKLTDDSHGKALSALTCSADLTDLSLIDLVIEAIFEDLAAKMELFNQLDKICKAGAMLATNTSYLDVNEIASATSRSEDVIGLHFFSPAHIMRLLEVVVAEKTSPTLVATTFDFAQSLRKIPVRAEVCEGFIGNRILTQYRKACEYLVLDGARFDQVDSALEKFGFAMGPFAVSDLAGLDIARATRQRKAANRPKEERYSRVADIICDEGWFGRKTDKGYYLYNDAKPVPNPDVQKIIENERQNLSLQPRDFTDEEIVARCLTAMIMEAANVLEDGITLRPVDIDAVELFGYGFPRHRGGPMHYADHIGLDTVIKQIETYAVEDSYFWQVPDLLRKMQKSGQCFNDINNQTDTG